MNYILRPWKGSDGECLCENANNKHIADNLRDDFPHPYTMDDALYFISLAKNYPKEKGVIYAIEFQGEAIGNISVEVKSGVFCKLAEVGYWLGEPYWRQGIMTSALSEITQMAFARYDITKVFGMVMEDNLGSRHVMEKAGLVLEGTLRKHIYKNEIYHNACIYSKIKED